jgi:hypothetical protein
VRNTIQEVALDIRAREFPARPGFYCRNCEYYSLCPAQEAGRGAAEEVEAAGAEQAVATSVAKVPTESQAQRLKPR